MAAKFHVLELSEKLVVNVVKGEIAALSKCFGVGFAKQSNI